MKRLGFFAELGGGEFATSMRDAVRLVADGDEAQIVAYLRAGTPVFDVMEMMPDVLDGVAVDRSASLVTDGLWYWREDLSHYVEKYHLRLDAEFIKYVVAHEFRQPKLDFKSTDHAARLVIRDWSSS